MSFIGGQKMAELILIPLSFSLSRGIWRRLFFGRDVNDLADL